MLNFSLITDNSALKKVRIAFWVLAIILGACESWVMRHEVISDGICYLEIASAYARGDWWGALNAYWSPFFSWIIALFLVVLRPPPYWQVAVVHLVLFVSFLASLLAFEWFTKELILSQPRTRPEQALPAIAIYICGYCSLLFAGLSMVGMWFCSPDMIASALILFVAALALNIRRTGGSTLHYVLFGALCACCYFARTALVAPMIVYCAAILFTLHKQNRPILRPGLIVAITALVLVTPYILGLSKKEGHFDIGDSGKLNYAWEVDGAHRWIHWQGEPGDIGRPQHPTSLVIPSPKTFVFPEPAEGSYAPWLDPAYWNAGIKPKVKVKEQIWLIVVNISVLCNLIIRSPLFIPVCLLALLTGFWSWWRNLVSLWLILVPLFAGLGVYTLVYIERRYIAATLLILWMSMLVSLRIPQPRFQKVAASVVVLCSLIFFGGYMARRLIYSVKDTASDLIHRRETVWNVNYMLAQRLLALGLCPGDRIGIVGPGMNFDAARLAHLRIVAEVPLMYSRNERILNNLHVDDPTEIQHFFNLNREGREPVLQAMRNSGAKMIITDGFESRKLNTGWQRLLRPDDPHLPKADVDTYTQQNARYDWLVPEHGACTVTGPLALGRSTTR